jgi:4-hydroxythreonine-4-phosphate dehydrogenase|tara:strand:+ start:272 stop:1261 length:990 start_codon:yes stop_codon:yes gene_type:complete
MHHLPPEHLIAVTVGEPAGIGPEICLDLINHEWSENLVIVSDPAVIRERAKELNKVIHFIEWQPSVIRPERLPKDTLYIRTKTFSSKVICGEPNYQNSLILMDGLEETIDFCLNGTYKAMVTAPVNKAVINEAGIKFTGHTEFIAKQTNTNTPVMLLAADNLRVALATTHIPVSKISSHITKDKLRKIINILHADLKKYFKIKSPRILVCGLNPHAGENGHLGSEEQEIIEPVIKEFQNKNFNIEGPIPADTIFLKAEKDSDVVLAMFHDQGLPVLKYAGFGEAVNITLGLPFVRTSVDHGTAFDIAGKGKASSDSLIAAIELAIEMIK